VARRLLPRRLRHGEEATLVEHLGELRARLLISLGSLIVAFVPAFVFHERIVEVLTRPLPDDRKLVTFGVLEPLTISVKVSLYTAFAAALPIVLYQLWAFLAPAMEERSQRIVAAFTAMSTALFATGVTFAYFVVLPRALEFLTHFDEELYEIQIRANYYYSFVSIALVGIGLAFEMPIFILALVRLQVLSSDRLRSNRRLGVFLIVVIAVLLPTADPVSLAFEIAPLLVLYELSIWLAVLMERRWERAGVLWPSTR
jgi:sec-independent protein translocase protein TatC